MDLNLIPNELQFRDEFRAWLNINVPKEWKRGTSAEDCDDYIEYLRDWQRKLYEGGWAGISWPKENGGGGARLMVQTIFYEEMWLVYAPHYICPNGVSPLGADNICAGTEAHSIQH